MQERHLERESQRSDDLPGTKPDEQPGMPDESTGPAEGGD